MNKVKADNVLNIIKSNFDTRKNMVDQILTLPTSDESVDEEVSLKSINAILLDLKNSFAQNNFDTQFDAYCKNNGLNDQNIKRLAKVKNLETFKEKVEICFYNPKSYFNSFVYRTYLELSDDLQNSSSTDATPKDLFECLDQKRKNLALAPISAVTNPVLANLAIDEDRVIVQSSFDYKTANDELLKKFKKLGISVEEKDVDASFANGNNITLDTSLNEKDSKLFGENLKYLNLIYYFCSLSEGKNFASLMQENEEISNKLTSLIKSSQLDYAKFETIFNELNNLIVTENVLYTMLDESEYAELSKVVEYNICQKLAIISQKINSPLITELLIDGVVNNTVAIYQKLGLSLNNLKDIYKKVSKTIDNNSSYEAFVLCPLWINYSTKSDVVGKTFHLNYDKLVGLESYQSRIQEYKQKFDEIINANVILKNRAINDVKVAKKMDELYNNILSLKSMIEGKNHLLTSQCKLILDTHAFCDVAGAVVEQISNDVFNHEIVVDEKSLKVEDDHINHEQDNISEYKDIKNENSLDDIYNINIDFDSMEPTTFDYENFNYDQILKYMEEFAQKNTENVSNDVVDVYATDANKVVDAEIVEPNKEVEQTTSNNVAEPEIIDEVIDEEDEKASVGVQSNSVKSQQPISEQKQQEEQDKMMEDKFNKLLNSYEELKNKVDDLTKIANQKSAKELDQEKLSEMEQKVHNFTTISVKKAVSSLANKNVDELSQKLFYVKKERHGELSLLLTSLNMLFNMDSGDKTVRNMYISMNKAETAKSLMLLKYSLENVFANTITKFIASQAIKLDNTNLSDKEIVHQALIASNARLFESLENSRSAEIDMLNFMYAPDSFEYEDAVSAINAKYLGDDEQIGLMNQLKQNLYTTMLKDVILNEVQRIASCNANGKKYTFDEKHAKLVLTDLFYSHKEETDEMTF